MGWPQDVSDLAKNAKEAAESAIEYAEFMDPFDDWVPFSGPTEEDRQQPQLIHDRIMAFAAPRDHSAIGRMHGSLDGARKSVALNIEDSLAESRTLMAEGDWEGAAADGFKTFLSEMKDAVQNKKDTLEDLAQVAEAYRTLVEKMQTDVTDLVNAGIAALNDGKIDAKKIGESISQALLSGISSGGGATGALTSLTVDLAGKAIWEMASNELEVLHAFSGSLHSLRRLVEEQIKNVHKAYDAIIGHVTTNLPTIQPGRPGIITQKAFNPDEFALDEPEFQNNKSKVPTTGLVPQVTGLVPSGEAKPPR